MTEARNLLPMQTAANDPANNSAKSHSHSASWRHFASSLRDSVVGVTVLTTFVASLSFSAFFFYVPLYAYTLRGSIPVLAFLYPAFASLMAGTGVVSMIPLGHIEDATRRRMPVLVAGGLYRGGVFGVFFFFSRPLGFFLAWFFFFGFPFFVKGSLVALFWGRAGVGR